MTMAGYNALYLITVVTVACSALLFSVLALFYWRERRSRPRSAFTVFTQVCAAAFLINLLLRIVPRWETPLTVLLDAVTSLVPALLLHVVLQGRGRPLMIGFYAIGSVAGLISALDDLDAISVPFRDQLPAILLGLAGVLGVFLVRVEARPLRSWYRILLFLTGVVAVVNLTAPSAIARLAPDYLLLTVFCVTLYYQESLIFFDLLIKRGAFLGIAAVVVALVAWLEQSPDPVTVALTLLPFLLLAPWVDTRLGAWIDRAWLRRRYSAAEAELLFVNELQLASTERELRSLAEGCLSRVFQAAAEVYFGADPAPQGARDTMTAALRDLGWAVVQPRASGIPFMSDDQHLFDSFGRTLAVILQNVRFRELQQSQQERERQLLVLASRAELKALRAQINPHFLFNALNAIAGLIPTDPALADQTVEELAKVFRYTLRKSESEWVGLDEEAEFVHAYLRVERARFGDRLWTQVCLDPAAAQVPIPAMCIQPLIENAVRHGASLASGRGLVELRASVEGQFLLVEVSDNGPGFPARFSLAGSTGHGLRNVSERLAGYYGDLAQLRWGSSDGRTWVRLRIPCPVPAEVGRGASDARRDRR